MEGTEPGDTASEATTAEKVDKSFGAFIAVASRFLSTIRAVLIHPIKLIDEIISDRMSELSQPFIFLVASWLLYTSVMTSSTALSPIILAPKDDLSFSHLITKGISLSDILFSGAPLVASLAVGAWLIGKLFNLPPGSQIAIRRLACYIMPITFFILSVVNLSALAVGADRLKGFPGIVKVALMLSIVIAFAYPSILFYVSLSKLRDGASHRPDYLLRPFRAVVCFAFVLLIVGAGQSMKIWSAVAAAKIFRLLEPVTVVSEGSTGFMDPERWTFDLAMHNGTEDTLYLKKTSCQIPESFLGYTDLKLIDWSAHTDQVLELTPGGDGWARFEVTSLIEGSNGKKPILLAMDCDLGEKRVFQSFGINNFQNKALDSSGTK